MAVAIDAGPLPADRPRACPLCHGRLVIRSHPQLGLTTFCCEDRCAGVRVARRLQLPLDDEHRTVGLRCWVDR